MSKQEWRRHYAETTEGGQSHDRSSCPICARRRESSRSNARRRAHADAMRDMGIVHVRGSLGGHYWE